MPESKNWKGEGKKMKTLSNDSLRHIIARLVDNANIAFSDSKKDNHSEFESGRSLAYYEMLDTIKNELELNEQDLKDWGLDFDVYKKL